MNTYQNLGPILTAKDDFLGRRMLAQSLAMILESYDGKESLIVALYGEWGDGKTSVKNLILEKYKSQTTNPLVLDFNLWQASGEGDIQGRFFDEIAGTLGVEDVDPTYKEAATELRRLGRVRRGMSLLSKIGLNVTETLAAIPGIATAAEPVINAVAKTGEAERLASILETQQGHAEIAGLRKNIFDKLSAGERNIIVFLDDIDRLLPGEVASFFQLLKTAVDFPRLVFVILAQKSYLEECIDKIYGTGYSQKFLDKIIQVDFGLPRPSLNEVQEHLINGINSLLNDYAKDNKVDQQHWMDLYQGGLIEFFKNIRDVNRYLNSIQLSLGLVTGEGIFEVNCEDFLALEALRIFEPDVFHAIPSNKRMLTDRSGRSNFSKLTDSAPELILLNQLLQIGNDSRREAIREILVGLFPLLTPVGRHETPADQDKSLRICSPQFFDRYFRLAVPSNELSEAETIRLASAGDAKQVQDRFNEIDAAGLFPDAIDKLGKHFNRIEVQLIPDFICAILDHVELHYDPSANLFPRLESRACWLIKDLLMKLLPDSRSNVMSASIVNTSGLLTAIEIVERLAKVDESASKPPVFQGKDLQELQAILSSRLEIESVNGSLVSRVGFPSALHSWKRWGGQEHIDEFVKIVINDADQLNKFLSGFISVITSQGINFGSKYSPVTKKLRMRVDWINQWVEPDQIFGIIESEPSIVEGRPEIEVFLTAYKKWKENPNSDQVFGDDDDD